MDLHVEHMNREQVIGSYTAKTTIIGRWVMLSFSGFKVFPVVVKVSSGE
jgi:hypothetical protein